MSDEAPQVGVLLASPSELQVLQQTGAMLEKFGIPHEIRVMSALRNPDLVDEYARTAEDRGIQVIVCGGGLSGHLAGAVAARTVLPVVGVPISSKHASGSDALYSTAQMPSGVPVATVAVDGAVNAAILAAQIVGVRDEEVRRRLRKFKDDLAEGLKL
jgi:5-(carboxyamino)imidazole ribonucleotide mutase